MKNEIQQLGFFLAVQIGAVAMLVLTANHSVTAAFGGLLGLSIVNFYFLMKGSKKREPVGPWRGQ